MKIFLFLVLFLSQRINAEIAGNAVGTAASFSNGINIPVSAGDDCKGSNNKFCSGQTAIITNSIFTGSGPQTTCTFYGGTMHYTRIGNLVYVVGQGGANCTAGQLLVFSVPIPTRQFTAFTQLSGTGGCDAAAAWADLEAVPDSVFVKYTNRNTVCSGDHSFAFVYTIR